MTIALPRITARVDKETQELLSQAAAVSGVSSINSFVLSAAIEKAKSIMDRERSLKLSKSDAMLLISALDKSGEVNSRLQQAADRYKNKEQS
ncbi:MAG: DUF1778 domain-containing protein [Sedimenticola sp.]